MSISRRGFLGAILASGVAPFVVKADSLMAVRVPTSGLIASTSASSIQQIKEEIPSLQDHIIHDYMIDEMYLLRLMRNAAISVWPNKLP